jgi:IS1 family transposase
MERSASQPRRDTTLLFTDGGEGDERYVEAKEHTIGQAHTQQIESTHLNVRTRSKRVVRRTSGLAQTERMPDLALGRFLNR